MTRQQEPTSGGHPVAQLRLLAEQLAGEAAAFVRARRAEEFGRDRHGDNPVRHKSTPTDPVTVVDTETETLLRTRLAELRPADGVLGEEGGGPEPGSADSAAAVTWFPSPPRKSPWP